MTAPRIDRLLDALRRVPGGPPPDLAGFVAGRPEPGELPSPWETWVLVGLVRHRDRQRWVADLITTRLQGRPADLAAGGSFGHPPVPQSGPVPGLPEWEYYFHGRGCCVTHKVDGDRIDVDFFDDTADYYATFFYKHYLDALRRPEGPEQRLRYLDPSGHGLDVTVGDLLAAGALAPLPGRDAHPYRLADDVLAAADAVAAFCTAWEEPARRVWLAALVGDWLAADEAAAGRADLAAVTGPRAERCRELRRDRLRQGLAEPYRGGDALRALAALGAADLDQHLDTALVGPPTGLTSAALAVITEGNDPRWCDPVYALFRRVDPAGQPPQPHLWMTAHKFLLRHGYRPAELRARLADAGGSQIGEAVLLALEHAPERALPLIRKGLTADIPINRTEVAAILALIARPWSLRELLRALEVSDDQERTADARAAVLETGDEGAREAVRAWEERNPHEPETPSYLEVGGRTVGPFHTFGELALRNRASRLRYEMGELHDRVMRVRDVVPPAPPARPWWRFWGR